MQEQLNEILKTLENYQSLPIEKYPVSKQIEIIEAMEELEAMAEQLIYDEVA